MVIVFLDGGWDQGLVNIWEMSSSNDQFYNEAIDAVESMDLERARGAIEGALTEDPNDVQSWQLYAVILNAMGEAEKADKAQEKLKELGLSEADALVMKAADAIGQGKISVAITHYEDALEIEPDSPEIHVSYAMALMQGKYPDDAEEAARKAVELGGGDASAKYALGRILRLRGKKEEALGYLKGAAEAAPTMLVARYEAGMVLAEKGELDEALGCFEAVLAAAPTDEAAIAAKAAILARKEGLDAQG